MVVVVIVVVVTLRPQAAPQAQTAPLASPVASSSLVIICFFVGTVNQLETIGISQFPVIFPIIY